jgi:pentapeptide MXKDX repeat protein
MKQLLATFTLSALMLGFSLQTQAAEMMKDQQMHTMSQDCMKKDTMGNQMMSKDCMKKGSMHKENMSKAPMSAQPLQKQSMSQ